MLFPTVEFALFFAAVFVGAWFLVPGRTSWRVFMLASSGVFYGLFDWRFLGLLAAAALIGWVLMRGIAATRPRHAFLASTLAVLGVAVHLGALVWFKYSGHLAASVDALLATLGVRSSGTLLEVVMPVGASYLLFRGTSAIVDVRRDEAPAPSLLDHALFLSFFPYVASGPITRLREVVPQWSQRSVLSRERAADGLLLIAAGLVKKMLVADYLARAAVMDVFATPALFGSRDVLAGIYAYAAQIYCDFSGYTDMAIGIALLLGVVLPQNFAAPYAATSLREFWRRWHMTLSRFLRDYVYIPLGGSRRGAVRTRLNLVLTMVIAGLWHGVGWTFAVWGLLHGVGLAVGRRASEGIAGPAEGTRGRLRAAAGWFVTFQFACIGWVFFRAESLPKALEILGRLVSAWDVPGTLPAAVWVLAALVVVVQFVPARLREGTRRAFAALPPLAQALALAAVMFAVTVASPEGPAAFIYSGF